MRSRRRQSLPTLPRPTRQLIPTRNSRSLPPRASRAWLEDDGPGFSGAKTRALIEGDFYGDPSTGNESPQFRLRHAYGTIDWNNTRGLFGQYGDIFGPMLAATIDFRNGDSYGTPNEKRIPQIKLTQMVHIDADKDLKFLFGVQDPNQYGNNQSTTS